MFAWLENSIDETGGSMLRAHPWIAVAATCALSAPVLAQTPIPGMPIKEAPQAVGANRVPTAGPPVIDHHVHVLSPRLVADWKSLGVPFSRPDSVYTSAASLLEGDRATVGQAILVPMAHLYGMADFREAMKLSLEDEATRVRGENRYVAGEAARYPGQAVALCSVAVFRPYADQEIQWCRDSLRSAGLKVHLAASGADLSDEAQLGRLAALFAMAEAEHLPVLLHFDPQRRGLDVGDVERFITRVVDPHPNLELYLAHLGGSGGFGAWTQSVFRVFREWIGRNPDRPVFMEVSAALLEEESEGVPATTEAEGLALGEALRAVGLARVVFGSDYPVFDPRRYAAALAARTGLSPEELRSVLGNRGPRLIPRTPD